MDRPYIFCHMMTSLDGKIMGQYMDTPEGSAAGEVFYNISFGKEPHYKHQGWLSGRVTTDDNFTFYEKPELNENTLAVPEILLLKSRICTMFSLILQGSRAGKAIL